MTERLAPDASGIGRAAALIRSGALVAFGTETVYGLGADATDERAVALVFDAKGRPHFNPLICHYADARAASADVEIDDRGRALADAFWPGPLTLVLRRSPSCRIALLAGAGLSTVAVRVPAGEAVRSLLGIVGRPVAAPSANRSGRISPTNADHVIEELEGRIAAVLDTGNCAVGLESSVVDLTGPMPFLLRPGGIAAEAIEAVAGRLARGITPGEAEAARGLRSPGLMVSHYAPALPLRLEAGRAEVDEALLAFGPAPPGAGRAGHRGATGAGGEAAARLYGGLRFLDAEGRRMGLRRIAAMAVPASGLGMAIRDRLERAAAPRSG